MTISHFFFALFISFIWGSMFVVATFALFDFPPVFFTTLRFALLSILLAPYLIVPREKIWPLVKIGIMMGVGMYLTLYLSLYLAENTASIALVSKLEVPFALILGVVILKEHIGPQRMAGISLAMLGAIVIGFDPAAVNDIPALVAMAVSSVFYALTMIMVRTLEGVRPLTITAWVALVSTPVLLIVSCSFEDNHMQVLETASLRSWLAFAYTVIFGSIVAHTGMYYLLQHYPIKLIVPFNLLSPVFGVAGGILLLDDVLTPGLIIGGAMVLVGVGWIHFRVHR